MRSARSRSYYTLRNRRIFVASDALRAAALDAPITVAEMAAHLHMDESALGKYIRRALVIGPKVAPRIEQLGILLGLQPGEALTRVGAEAR